MLVIFLFQRKEIKLEMMFLVLEIKVNKTYQDSLHQF